MSLIVQKYGGTSLKDAERIRKVATKILKCSRKADVVVVASAMAGETDRYIEISREISSYPPLREYDMLLSSGEQVSAALLSMALNEIGIKSRAFLAFQLPIITDNNHSSALIKEITVEKIQNALSQGEIPVVAGFQGLTPGGDITTLGRGGSDTTAVALAAALGADLCEIFTDVEGVYTCNPQINSKARKISRISYSEMMEFAVLGAKVLHPRCVELAQKYEVEMLVRSSFNENEGTQVSKEGEKKVEGALISGVTYTRGEAKITVVGVPDEPGVASRIFIPLADAGINVDMIVQNISRFGTTDVTFTVPEKDLPYSREVVEQTAQEIGAKEVIENKDISKVSIVGAGMKTHPGVASTMFKALAREGINIMMISTSDINISCIIDVKYTELAVRVLHDVFALGG